MVWAVFDWGSFFDYNGGFIRERSAQDSWRVCLRKICHCEGAMTASGFCPLESVIAGVKLGLTTKLLIHSCDLMFWLLQLPPHWPTLMQTILPPVHHECCWQALLSAAQYMPPLSANPSLISDDSRIRFQTLTKYKTTRNSAPTYINNFILKYHPNCLLHTFQDSPAL